MLVLTRRRNERIHIGADVEVVVVGIKGNRVQLGFITSPEVPILREELAGRPAATSRRPADASAQAYERLE